MSPVNVEFHNDVGLLRLTNGVINPVSMEMVEKLSSAVMSARDQFKGLVLAGGEKFFSLGFNIPELLELDRKGMSAFFFEFNQTVLNLYSIPIPTACAMKGHAIAGETNISIQKMSCGINSKFSGLSI